MGIYKRIVDVETEVVKFHKNFVVELESTLEQMNKQVDVLKSPELIGKEHSLIKSHISKLTTRIELLKNYQNEIIYAMSEFQKHVALLKKNITNDYMLIVQADITKLKKIILDLLSQHSNNHIEITLYNRYTDNNSSSIDPMARFFIKNSALATDFFDKISKELKIIIQIVDDLQSNSKTNFKEFLGFGHEHKIQLDIELSNNNLLRKIPLKRKVNLIFTSKLDFTKKIYDTGKFSIEEKIRGDCMYIISKYPEYEQKCLEIISLSTGQLEQKALEILRNTFLEVIKNRPEIIRDNLKRINVELVLEKFELGRYQIPRSDFIEIFINISINDELLWVLEVQNSILLPSSNMYDTIIHELVHAYDWQLNTKPIDNPQFKETAKRIVKGTSEKSIKLANILTGLRVEGLGRLSRLYVKMGDTGPYENIRMYLNCPMIEEFYSLIHQDEISAEDIDKAGDKGTIHEAGELMAKIIFLDETRGKFLYSKDDIYGTKASSILTKGNVREMRSGAGYILSAEPKIMKYEINNFIKKLSIMSPEVFLQKYEEACYNFDIPPIISKEDFRKANRREEPRRNILEKISGSLFRNH